ncbi:MAG: dihydrodipicolinate synthase family protein [Protaetiibacter sp.]
MRDDNALTGVTAPIVTPLDDDGRPDEHATHELLAALAHEGVDSLLLLGSNGEGALLPPDRTYGFLTAAVAAWRSLRPGGSVLVNVSAPGTTDALRRAEMALGADPDVLVITPPTYFHHRADEIADHLRAIETFARPWAIYNVPKYACPLTPQVLGELLAEPHLVGMKDSSGDLALMTEFVAVLTTRPGLALSQGDERNLVTGLLAGARGIVPGLANIAPGLVARLYREVSEQRLEEAYRSQDTLTALTDVHAIRPGVPTVKAVLRNRGILPNAACAPPLRSVEPAEAEAISEFLSPFDPWLIGGDPEARTDSHQERPA